jgi:phosphate transport system protein
MVTNLNEDVKHIKTKILEIAKGLEDANNLILEALDDCNYEKFEKSKSFITNVTPKANDIDNEVIKVLALYSPEAKDLRQMVSYFKITNELVRATGNTRSFINGFTELCSKMDIDVVKEYAIPMQKATTKAISLVNKMINVECLDELQEIYNEALIEENKTDDLYESVEKKLLELVKQEDDSMQFEIYHNMLKALRKGEKIADRAMSIANLLLYVKIGGSIHQN